MWALGLSAMNPCWLNVGLACFLAAASQAADERTLSAATKLYDDGLKSLRQARKSSPPNEAVGRLEQAIAQFQEATELRPEYSLAHARWAQCLAESALLTDDPPQRWAQVQTALARFATATNGEALEWTVYKSWGEFLSENAGRLASDAAQRRALFEHVRKACEAGIAQTRFASQRSWLQFKSGASLLQLAELSEVAADK